MILIVLGTDHFVKRHFLLTLVAPVTLSRIPRHRERTGILNVNLDFHFVAAFDELIALDDMELVGVRRAEIVDIGPIVKTNSIDHQRVAVFIVPDGFAVPRRLGLEVWGTFR